MSQAYGLMFVPVFFVGMNFLQHKKTLDAAKRYLAESRHNAAMVAAMVEE